MNIKYNIDNYRNITDNDFSFFSKESFVKVIYLSNLVT